MLNDLLLRVSANVYIMRKVTPRNAKLIPKNAKKVFEGVIFDVYQWDQTMFDGSTETFEMLRRPDTVKILAIKEGKIIVLRQEQPDSNKAFYDTPGGRHDVDSEDELQAAQRETLEETGMSFKNWKLVEVTQPTAKIDYFIYIFVAWEVEKITDQTLDNGEKIEVLELTLDELRQLGRGDSARHLPGEILNRITSINELIELPEYK